MKEVIYEVIRQVGYFPFEFLTAICVFGILLKKRKPFVLRLAASLVFILVIQTLSGALFFNRTTADIYLLRYWGWFIIMFAAMMLVLLFCTEVSIREALYCVTCAYAIEHIAYCVRLLLNEATDSSVGDAGQPLYFVIHLGVYLLCYFFYAREMVKNNHFAIESLQFLVLMVSVLFVVLVMSLLATNYDFEGIHGIYASICCLFMLTSQKNHIRQLNQQREFDARERLWMMNRAQYKISRENIDIINRKCHDLKHQITELRKIENLDKQQELLDSIEKSVMIYETILHTGNPLLDSVLTEKGLICTEHDISLHCIIQGEILDFMEAVDLYSLFGNALDNAIEGNLKLEDKEDRNIGILVHEKVNMIFIQFENPYEGELALKDGIPVTDKKDVRFHGYGIKSILHIAEKYGGFVKMEYENKVFVLRITLPKGQLRHKNNNIGRSRSR